MYGINYEGKHSFKDFNVTILNTREISTPQKKKITVTVPFMSGSYDFSNLYNGLCFDERVIEYEFLIKESSSEKLEFKRMQLEAWLLSTNEKTILVDDNLRGYYYSAECREIEFEEINHIGKMRVTFVAYPFKFSNAFEGKLLWDDFNFELDTLQKTTFEIKGRKLVTIYNPSAINISPEIITNSEMTIIKKRISYNFPEGISYNFPVGKTCNNDFCLDKGKNILEIKGTGKIEIRFRREVL